MATIALPRSRKIEVTATTNASMQQQVEIVGPEVNLTWSGTGEGQRIGEDVIQFPEGSGEVNVEVKTSSSTDGGVWSPSHEKVVAERENGRIHVIAEDGRGTLDGNDLVVRFHWVV